MLSDEHYEQACENIADALGRYGFSDDNLRAFEVDDLYHDLIAAVRAALCPPVTPLAPGETVLIDGESPVQWIEAGTMRDQPGLFFVTGGANLDAAGVRALRTACDRWLAAQEGQNCPESDEGGA